MRNVMHLFPCFKMGIFMNGYLFLILTPTEIYLIMTASFELQIERLNPGE